MIRHQVDIRFETVDAQHALAEIVAHHRAQPYLGDAFLPAQQLSGTPSAIMINGTEVGLLVINEETLVLCTLTRRARKYDRQVLEQVLRDFAVRQAFAASWDGHHVGLFGGFAREIASQAYQFELLDPDDLAPATASADGPTLTVATEADRPYLNGAGFLDDYTELLAAGGVRITRVQGIPVGIGLIVRHPIDDAIADLGMFTNDDARRRGIGRSTIADAARECVARGLRPVAGCWYRNWLSRPALEAAGLTCVGTIFRFTLDPDAFRS